MAYTKQTWQDGDITKPLSAARMSYIEDGIEAAHNLPGADVPFTLVAAADTVAAYKAFADYVCTGSSGNRIDHTTIKTAYDALPASGGEVWLAPGTYYFGGTLILDEEDCDLRFLSGALANWTTVTGTTPIVQVASSNVSVFNPECVGSGSKGNGTGLMIGGNTGAQPHNVNVWEPRLYNLDTGLDFAVEPPGGSDNSTGDCTVWGGRIYNSKDGIKSGAFVNHVQGSFISSCDRGVHQTTDRNSGKIIIHSATINNCLDVAVAIDRGRGSIIDNLWVEHTTGTGPTEVIRLGSSTNTVINPYIGKVHLHPLNATEQYVLRLVRCRGLVVDHMEVTDDLPTTALVRVDSHADNNNNRIRKISIGDAAPAGWSPSTMILSNASPNAFPVIIEEVPNIAGSAAGSTLGNGAAANGAATYTVFRDGTANTYFAKHRNGHIASVGFDVAATTSGLKAVIDAVKGNNVHLHFAGPTFSFLDDVVGQDHSTFTDIDGMTFTGEGMFHTLIRSYSTSTSGPDTEPLSFTRCQRITVSDLHLRAEGAPSRQSTDALDFDQGSECIVERVYVSYARGNGIHFDGKDYNLTITAASWTGGIATVTTGTHSFRAGMWVRIQNVNPAGYNGTFKVTAVTGTTISYGLDQDPTAWVSGGNAVGNARLNVVRDCIITGCQEDGVELLCADDTDVVNVTAYGNGGHGIQILKASNTATQPNRKSTGNKVIGGFYIGNGADGVNILSSDDNLVTGATIKDNARVTSSKDGVRIETTNSISADNNVIEGNIITDERGTKRQRYGVNVQPSTAAEANDNVVSNNSVVGNLTRGGNDAGTGTRWTDNTGFKTRSKGSATVSGTGGSATANITHGLDRTPTTVFISPTNVVATVQPHVTTKGASNFTVTFTAPSGSNNVAFDWVAEF